MDHRNSPEGSTEGKKIQKALVTSGTLSVVEAKLGQKHKIVEEMIL